MSADNQARGSVSEVEVERLRTVLDWHKRQLRVTQEALAVAQSTQASVSARAAKAVEAAFTALTAIGEARGFVAYCSKGDGLEHWLVQASTTLATLLSDHPAPEPGVEAGEVLKGIRLSGLAYQDEGKFPHVDVYFHTLEQAQAFHRLAQRALQTPADGGRDGK
jgi:hypothetical protein